MLSSTHAHIAAQAPLKYAVRNVVRRHAGLQHRKVHPHKKEGDNSQSKYVMYVRTYARERERERANRTYLMYNSAGWAALNHCIAPIVVPSPRTYATSEVAKNGLWNTGRCHCPFGRSVFGDASGERDLVTCTHAKSGRKKAQRRREERTSRTAGTGHTRAPGR